MELAKKIECLEEVRQCCISEFSPITELALWAANKIVDEPKYIACTDGRTIYFHNRFFEYSLPQQCFIYVHELNHIALRHAQRSVDFVNSVNDRQLWNYAADIIINEAIKTQKWLQPILGMLTYDSLPGEVKQELPLDKAGLRTEDLFELLKKHRTSNLKNPLEDLITTHEAEELSVEFTEGKEVPPLPEELEVEEMQEILSRMANYGSALGEFFKLLSGDLPKVHTPWQKYLNGFLQKKLAPKYKTFWGRPNRLYTAGIVDVYLPAQQKQQQYDHLIIAVDVSGSCWSDRLLSMFASNIVKIQRIYRCPITLVTFDTEIQDIMQFKAGSNTFAKALKDVKFHGGGGTDFLCLFEEFLQDHNKKIKVKPACMIIATDLYGPFPKSSKIPVLWACNRLLRPDDEFIPPFGQVVELA
ncbi:hypothetical protein OsccyDRAFT_0730 [Leptolyngbyaceae cyanobacterium JSC-12]|nr:hypothetical protein OsccyDRAFT_0730 [Leptolyngbyaceae cyanobacterium JSC-12]